MKHVLQYLRNWSELVYWLKMLLLGQVNSGKTTLMRVLKKLKIWFAKMDS